MGFGLLSKVTGLRPSGYMDDVPPLVVALLTFRFRMLLVHSLATPHPLLDFRQTSFPLLGCKELHDCIPTAPLALGLPRRGF